MEHHSNQVFLTVFHNPIDLLAIGSVFFASFLASIHCGFMCGPLVCSKFAYDARPPLLPILRYNLGRVVSYSLMGWILASIGGQIAGQLPDQKWMPFIIGGCLVVSSAALLMKGGHLVNWGLPWQNFGSGILRRLMRFDFGFGMATVFLPCATLSPMLLFAAGAQTPMHGALYLCAFALGTVPAMVVSTYMPTIGVRSLPLSWRRFSLPSLLLVAGLVTLMRGLHPH